MVPADFAADGFEDLDFAASFESRDDDIGDDDDNDDGEDDDDDKGCIFEFRKAGFVPPAQ